MTQATDNLLRHNGYTGSVDVSIEDGCMHGRLLHIDDLITYDGNTVAELQAEFIVAVNDYLAFCKEINKTPNKPYTGSFNVRIGADRHRWLVETGSARQQGLNETVCAAIDALRAQRDAPPAAAATAHQILAYHMKPGVAESRITSGHFNYLSQEAPLAATERSARSSSGRRPN